ncbi:MAG: hypothetical protein RIR86_2098 [Acidobacteriota bacterium]
MRVNTDQKNGTFSIIASGTGREVKLTMQELTLTGTILPVGAVLRVRHVFRSGEAETVEIIYAFGLPRDAALRRFQIVGDGFSVESELKPKAEAEKIYEKGIENGSLSSLARQYRDGVINLSVGNIRAGETVVVDLELVAGVELRDDGLRFRFPFTLAPTYHSQARSSEIRKGVGELELPAEFDNLVLPNWMKDAQGLHRIGFDLAVSIPQGVAEVGSPSHAIRFRQENDGHHRVMLAQEGDIPDRDLVLDIRTHATGAEATGVTGGLMENGHGHFALLVPSTVLGEPANRASRLVFVVDRSGSMEGQPMIQARKAIEACLGTMSPEDQFGIVAFDDQIETLSENLRDGSLKSREAARSFLDRVDARGGTELAAGFLAAAKMLGAAGGDMMILTDGQVSGTEMILASARATGIRIHCLGIGSSSQDRFLTLLARETGGVSRFVTPRERVDLEAIELYASIGRPVATQIEVEAKGVDFAPAPPSTIFAGHPLVLFGESEACPETVVHLSWEGPVGRQRLDIPVNLTHRGGADAASSASSASSVRLLQGARLITNLEAQGGKVGETGSLGAERRQRLLSKLSLKYGLASQVVSLVAVVKRRGDQSTVIPKTMVVPVGMPDQTRFDAYFNTYGSSRMDTRATMACPAKSMGKQGLFSLIKDIFEIERGSSSVPETRKRSRSLSGWFRRQESDDPEPIDLLVRLAGQIEPDGGMPGGNSDERWIATALTLLALLSEGHTAQTGVFRLHVVRLLGFLRSATPLDAASPRRRFLEMVEAGMPPPFKDGLRSITDVSGSGTLRDASTLHLIWKKVEKSLPGQ